jgi:hypothetical protein
VVLWHARLSSYLAVVNFRWKNALKNNSIWYLTYRRRMKWNKFLSWKKRKAIQCFWLKNGRILIGNKFKAFTFGGSHDFCTCKIIRHNIV